MALKPCIECKREISTEAKTCPHCGKKNPTTSPADQAKGCAGCLIILGVLAIIGMCSKDTVPSLTPSASSFTPAPPSPKEDAMARTALEFTWSKDGFGNVMVATFKISNKSDYSIKDIEIACTHSANSGTVIDSNTRTLYEIVQPGQTRRFPKVNMGLIHSQATQSSCRIADLVAY